MAVNEQRIDAFLVPGAYPQLNQFIMDDALVASNTFIMGIPSLVLAINRLEPSRSVESIFHHPATTALLAEIHLHYVHSIHTSSNTESCRKLLENPKNSACITNALCASHFKLDVIQVLRQEILMPWVCFKKSSRGN